MPRKSVQLSGASPNPWIAGLFEGVFNNKKGATS
ncbi:hypothetical protein EDF66_101203 [Sphingobacterium sp. JUb20]|nr:hypothetical protein [Sphingobacterium sp. JUb21]TCR10389.1 hypothetical protein EDF66_101203 [Sphingobacterium sp. JUb20]